MSGYPFDEFEKNLHPITRIKNVCPMSHGISKRT